MAWFVMCLQVTLFAADPYYSMKPRKPGSPGSLWVRTLPETLPIPLPRDDWGWLHASTFPSSNPATLCFLNTTDLFPPSVILLPFPLQVCCGCLECEGFCGHINNAILTLSSRDHNFLFQVQQSNKRTKNNRDNSIKPSKQAREYLVGVGKKLGKETVGEKQFPLTIDSYTHVWPVDTPPSHRLDTVTPLLPPL